MSWPKSGTVSDTGITDSNGVFSPFDNDKHEEDQKQLDDEFPNIKFPICLDLVDLDRVISTQPVLAIKFDHKCYCYGWCIEGNSDDEYTYTFDPSDPFGFSTAWAEENTHHENKRPIEYYYCRNGGNGITERDVLKQLEKDEYNPFCNHRFCEGIYGTEGQVLIRWGS